MHTLQAMVKTASNQSVPPHHELVNQVNQVMGRSNSSPVQSHDVADMLVLIDNGSDVLEKTTNQQTHIEDCSQQ